MPPSRKNWKPVTYCLIPFPTSRRYGLTHGEYYGNGCISSVNAGTGEVSAELLPNVFHVFGEVSVLNVTFGKGFPGIANEYMFQFSSGVTPTVLNLPEGVKWIGSSVVRANRTYQVSILNNIAVMGGA